MSKAVCFNIPATGHVNASSPAIAELVRRGEQIVYVNTEPYRRAVEVLGAQFQPYPDVATREIDMLMGESNTGNIPRNALALVHIGEQLLPWTLDLLRSAQPDYVIIDSLAAWSYQAARLLKLPTVSMTSTFVLRPGQSLPISPGMLLNTLLQMLRVYPDFLRTRARVRRQHGISVSLFGALMAPGDLNLVFTSADFQPDGASFGPEYKFVGPALTERPFEGDFPFDALTRKPLVYISLGTINNRKQDFYRACFEAFADHPGQFVLSVGKATAISSLGSIPPNFIVKNFVPQLELLKRVDVFITHGGMNSVQEGLWYGVPLVVVPQQLEQAIVAGEVVKRGAGVARGSKPPYGKVSPSELRQAVDQVLADSTLKSRAAALGEGLRQAGGSTRAAEEILRFRRERATT